MRQRICRVVMLAHHSCAMMLGLVSLALVSETNRDLPCDEQAVRLAEGLDEARAYRPRDNRCEGVYRKSFSDTDQKHEAFLLSILSADSTFEIDGLHPLRVSWPRSDLVRGTDLVRLYATSKRHGLYYQMDAEARMDREFIWPTNTLRSVGVAPEELTVMGSVETSIGGEKLEIILPLTIKTDKRAEDDRGTAHEARQADDPTKYRLKIQLRTRRDVMSSNVDVRMVRGGSDDRFYRREEPIFLTPTSRLRVYTFALDLAPIDGVHQVNLNLNLRGDVPCSLEFYCVVHKGATVRK